MESRTQRGMSCVKYPIKSVLNEDSTTENVLIKTLFLNFTSRLTPILDFGFSTWCNISCLHSVGKG